MGKFFKAFKNFLLEGDALSMAVGVIIGAAMKDLVTSLVDNVFTPIIGLVLGQVDFSALSFGIGDAQIKYGAFITSIINFVLLAFVVFLIIYLIDIIKACYFCACHVRPPALSDPSTVQGIPYYLHTD